MQKIAQATINRNFLKNKIYNIYKIFIDIKILR